MYFLCLNYCAFYFCDYQCSFLLYSHYIFVSNVVLFSILCDVIFFLTFKLVLWSFTIIMRALKGCSLPRDGKLSNKGGMWWRSQSFFIWSVGKQIDMRRAWSFTSWTFFYFCAVCFTVWCVCFFYIIHFMCKTLSQKKKVWR